MACWNSSDRCGRFAGDDQACPDRHGPLPPGCEFACEILLLDHRSAQGAQGAQEIRKGLYWRNSWFAIFDASGKRYDIKFPSASEPERVQHILKMLRSTSRRMTEEDFQTLQRALDRTE